MTTKDTATARPWTVTLVPGSYMRPAYIEANGRVIAECRGDQLTPGAASIGEATANAALIVRAVNAHEAMREALWEIVNTESAKRCREKARAALALVDG